MAKPNKNTLLAMLAAYQEFHKRTLAICEDKIQTSPLWEGNLDHIVNIQDANRRLEIRVAALRK